jgi:hypothetical protein
LTNQTNGWALADAVRVEKISATSTSTAPAASLVAPPPARTGPLAARRSAFELLTPT